MNVFQSIFSKKYLSPKSKMATDFLPFCWHRALDPWEWTSQKYYTQRMLRLWKKGHSVGPAAPLLPTSARPDGPGVDHLQHHDQKPQESCKSHSGSQLEGFLWLRNARCGRPPYRSFTSCQLFKAFPTYIFVNSSGIKMVIKSKVFSQISWPLRWKKKKNSFNSNDIISFFSFH